jgi:hypothetical protein
MSASIPQDFKKLTCDKFDSFIMLGSYLALDSGSHAKMQGYKECHVPIWY